MMRRHLLTALALLLAPLGASAQGLADYDYENLTFRGIGFDYGYIWPSKVAAAPLYSARIDLGYLGPGVRIAPTISYWSSKFQRSELERLADRLEQLPVLREQNVTIDAADLGTVEWSDLSLGIDAHMVWTTPIALMTFIGANLGVHALNGRGDAIADTFVEDLLDSTTAGAGVMAGVEYQLMSRLRIYGEARYTLLSDVHYPSLRAGAALMLPTAQRSTRSVGGGE